MFVIETHRGYLHRAARKFTSDITQAKLFDTERSARAINVMCVWDAVEEARLLRIDESCEFRVVRVKVTVEKITD